MGINFILPLIAGIVMTVILGTQVAPSLVENMKIKKVENRAISNQIAIKDAIVRYISLTGEYPKDFDDLKSQGLLKDYHEDNLFSGGYSFLINEEKGTLTIYTQFDDDKAGNYFKNSFSTPNKPICVEKVGETCKDNLYETFYMLPLLEKEVLEVGSKEYIEKVFTEEKLGDKEYYVENPPKDGDKDYVYVAEDKVEEFIYDKINNEWVSNGEKVVGGLGKSSGVEIKNVEVPQQMMDASGNRSIENKLFEKVVCRTPLDSNNIPTIHPKENEEVFVINENTGLGEIIWVAPNVVADIQTKIFLDNTSTSPVVYTPNNICTSNVSSMTSLFNTKIKFNSPLDRWDVSNVTSMSDMFINVAIFNQDIDNWDVSKVENMSNMFYNTSDFNKPLNSWDVSNVTNMSFMFSSTIEFNQDISGWNVSNVTNMNQMFSYALEFDEPLDKWDVRKVKNMWGMFYGAEEFNQALNSWDVSSVTDMSGMFRNASSFNQDISNWNLSNITDNMYNMFEGAQKFNQNLSGWCVFQIKTEPGSFDDDTPAWTEPKPKWGVSCP